MPAYVEGNTTGTLSGSTYSNLAQPVKFSVARRLTELTFVAGQTGSWDLLQGATVLATVAGTANVAAKFTGLNLAFAANVAQTLRIRRTNGAASTVYYNSPATRTTGALTVGSWDEAAAASYHLPWIVGSELPLPPSTWWDGAALQNAALTGWWDGAAIQPATQVGRWDGAAIQPLA